ncbi:thioredoxin family protein [Caenimonas aquaedulcis]|uniref:Thioredoxin family protein n=1 Tax=Caenimonas aquaedulcis TaxID=2793270 RepID=A0A931MH46_9BURK|nr:thioredoxin family protein [Caenimonas aquaedulcis]MBG9388533.1 thioredoxin family protein [Caenimonas aquaedulcis]
MAAHDESGDAWQVICLCAEWCGVCRQWRTIFDEAARTHPAIHFSWIDVEDEADAMGDVDVETFPTVLVARGATPLFFGPVQPSGAQLTRLIESLKAGSGTAVKPETASLLARLAPLTLSKP